MYKLLLYSLLTSLFVFSADNLCTSQIQSCIDVHTLPGTYSAIALKPQGYFPVLIETQTGELISVLRGSAGHIGVKGNLLLIRSKDGGKTWSAPTVAVDSEWDDRNPALGTLPDGTLILAYHENRCYDANGKYVADGPGHAYIRALRSDDNGATWKHLIPEDWKGFGNLQYCSPFGQILAEPNGQLLLLLYGQPGLLEEKLSLAEKYDTSYLIRSRDTGFNWTQPIKIADGMNETAMVIAPNGDYLALMRSTEKQMIYVSRSNNGGLNWTKPMAITDPEEHPATAVVLGNGTILLIFGVRHKPYGIQGILSLDNGNTWDTTHRILLNDKLTTWDIGYPSAIRRKDGSVVTIYYATDAPADVYGFATSRAEVIVFNEKELLEAYTKITK